MLRIILVTVVCFASCPILAQTSPSPPQAPMVIEPADADAFRDIVESTIPPRYNTALIRWYTAILQRQQAKQAEFAKQAKPSEEPK
jgi:hypothetical protein